MLPRFQNEFFLYKSVYFYLNRFIYSFRNEFIFTYNILIFKDIYQFKFMLFKICEKLFLIFNIINLLADNYILHFHEW